MPFYRRLHRKTRYPRGWPLLLDMEADKTQSLLSTKTSPLAKNLLGMELEVTSLQTQNLTTTTSKSKMSSLSYSSRRNN